MSPASYVIRVLGGVRPTARMLSRNPSSVSRWKFSVPVGLHKKILYLARVKNLDITPNDLVYGRKTK